jgi:hypothetical protein
VQDARTTTLVGLQAVRILPAKPAAINGVIWSVVERLDLSAFHAPIKARDGVCGRDATDPRLLVALWLYALRPDIKFVERRPASQCDFPNQRGLGKQLDHCRDHASSSTRRNTAAPSRPSAYAATSSAVTSS